MTLADVAEHAMDNMLPPDTEITRLDIRNLQEMRAELKVNNKLAKNEQYAVPVLVEDEMATVHLQIVRTSDEKGKVNIVFETDALGKVAAEMNNISGKIETMIAGESSETLEKFAEVSGEIEEALSTDGREVNIHLVKQSPLDITAFEMQERSKKVIESAVSPEDEDESNKIQTAELYKMAKAFLGMMVKIGKTI